jgi:enterochelin esterase-like enzyme
MMATEPPAVMPVTDRSPGGGTEAGRRGCVGRLAGWLPCLVVVIVVLFSVVVGSALAATVPVLQGPLGLPSDWALARLGPDGGAVWEGRIPNGFARWDQRRSAIYFPRGYDPRRSYPVIYLLHGMRGSPSSYVSGLDFAAVADGLISSGAATPFLAVIPVAGPVVNPDSGEWAGIWEDYLVSDVVPWVDSHLPTIASPAGRALEGFCAGGYGAVDIGLRNPGLFGTLGSWEGYFAPVFNDGPFVQATAADLAAHNPTLLLRREAPQLRSAGVRFYISVGGNHGQVLAAWSLQFAHELNTLGLSHQLWRLPASQAGHFWSATMPSALTYAAEAFTNPQAEITTQKAG